MFNSVLPPEITLVVERVRDLLNWHESLKRCAPEFAKRFIMERLRLTGAVDDSGARWLLVALGLGAV